MRLQGFHKILKKHDKLMPHAPCRQFYITHLHQQPWVQVSPSLPFHMSILPCRQSTYGQELVPHIQATCKP